MIPLRDNIPSKTYPFTTVTIIIINALVFLYQSALGRVGGRYFIYAFSVLPTEFSQMQSILPHRPFPFIFSLFTCMFIHGSLLHITGNMLYLWVFGDNVEDRMGHGRFLLFYLTCGIIGTLAHVSFNPASNAPMVGASGAIAGVLGAYLLLYPGAKITTLFFFFIFVRLIELPAILVLGFWILIQILNGTKTLGLNLPGGVAWFAHIGGFVSGMVLVPFFARKQ